MNWKVKHISYVAVTNDSNGNPVALFQSEDLNDVLRFKRAHSLSYDFILILKQTDFF